MPPSKKLLVILCFLFAGCMPNQHSSFPDQFADTATYLKIYEDSIHPIRLHGNDITINDLERRFAAIKDNRGLVLYSNGRDSNPPVSGAVFELIKKYRVSIKMYRDSTFTKSFE